uniref:Uncharacterized protein n=1 Tax=Strigamia maritima TaxID=126957 RepID=T1JK89_STRMM
MVPKRKRNWCWAGKRSCGGTLSMRLPDYGHALRPLRSGFGGIGSLEDTRNAAEEHRCRMLIRAIDAQPYFD